MWMRDLLKYIEFILHEIKQSLMHLHTGLPDYLNCTLKVTLQINCFTNFAKGTLAEFHLQIVVLLYVINFFESNEIFVSDHSFEFRGTSLLRVIQLWVGDLVHVLTALQTKTQLSHLYL